MNKKEEKKVGKILRFYRLYYFRNLTTIQVIHMHKFRYKAVKGIH